MLQRIKDSAAYISRFLDKEKYTIGIILGTGLGELGKAIEIRHTIPYAVSVCHARKTRSQFIDVFAAQRMFGEEVDLDYLFVNSTGPQRQGQEWLSWFPSVQ